MSEQFKTSPSTVSDGTTLTSGCGPWMAGIGYTLLSLVLLAIPLIGPLLFILCFGWAMWCYVKAFKAGINEKGILRTGNCPHCETPLVLLNQENAAKSCPSCKHRIVVRGEVFMDVTG